MALSVHTLVCKVCVILLSCVPVTWSACPSGPATYCSSPNMQYLGISANLLLTGQTASSCRDYCLASPPCKAVTFISGPGACTLYNTNHLTAGTLIAKSSINYYYYVCGGAVCGSGEVTITTTTTTTPGPTTTTTSSTTQPTTTTTTSTTTTRPTTTTNAASTTTSTAATTSKATSPSTTHKQPGYTTTKASTGNGMTPEEFWVWVRDDPLWLTLIGMGLMIFIEFWIIMYLFCRLKQQQKYHDDADSDDDSD